MAYIDFLRKYNIVLSPDGNEPLIKKMLSNLVHERRLTSKNTPNIIKLNQIYKVRPSIIV